MKRNRCFTFCIVMMWTLRSIAQQPALVNCVVEAKEMINAGDTFDISVKINIGKGWYVYAPVEINKKQSMQVTQVRFTPLPSEVRIVRSIQVPPAKQRGMYAVYQDDGHVFKQSFVLDKSAKGSLLILQGKLTYQACNDMMCYPPVTEKFEKQIHIGSNITLAGSGLPDADSALKLVENAGALFNGESDVLRYRRMTPLQMKRYEDSVFAKQINAAFWYCKNYPFDMRYLQAVNMYMGRDPLFINSKGNESPDTVQLYRGLDWKAFMRSIVIDTAARNSWYRTGDSLVTLCVNKSLLAEERESILFSKFARDFRSARIRFSLLPQKKEEESYWLLVEENYWQLLYKKFREHMEQFADLPVLGDRARDFLSALKSASPLIAENFWRSILQDVSANPAELHAGLKRLKAVAEEQLAALDTERGVNSLQMSFRAMDSSLFDMSKLKGKAIVIDFWASWCKPCVEELPFLRALNDKYRGRGLEIAGICLDDSTALPNVKAIMRKSRVNWPQRFEGKGFSGDSYRLLYGINSLPTVWVVDGSGRIVSRSARGEKLEALVMELLKINDAQ